MCYLSEESLEGFHFSIWHTWWQEIVWASHFLTLFSLRAELFNFLLKCGQVLKSLALELSRSDMKWPMTLAHERSHSLLAGIFVLGDWSYCVEALPCRGLHAGKSHGSVPADTSGQDQLPNSSQMYQVRLMKHPGDLVFESYPRLQCSKLLILISILCVWVFHLYLRTWCLESEEGSRTPGIGIIDVCELPFAYRELNPGSLEEHLVTVTA